MKRCLNCMKVYTGEYDVCPYCGYVQGTPPEVASHLTPGTVIAGRYIIGTVIEHGGFGIVYRAWDDVLGIKMAIKEFYPNGLVNRVPGTKNVVVLGGERREQYLIGLKRFLEEARTMAKFENLPNAVHVYEFLEENHTAYLVMEFLEGIALDKYLKELGDKNMEIDDAISIVTEVCKALTEIHKAKVVHRDLSPDNIFICKDGRVKLLDFGAARLSSGEKTQTLSVILKPGYAPPEQYRRKSRQGPRTDIYALGATLYKMITGEKPVESLDRLVDEDTLKKPSELNSKVPEWLDTVILTAMAKNAEVRFSTAQKFMEALNQEKEVKLPEKRIKKRRTIRAASILTIALAVGVISYQYLGIYNDISGEGVPDGEIQVMIPVAKEADKTRFEEFSDRFEAKFEGKKLDIEYVSSDEYEQRLDNALENEEGTDLFMGAYLSADKQECKENVAKIIENLETEQLYLVKENENFLKERNYVPIGFDAYGIYENTYLSKDIGTSYFDAGGVEVNEEPADSKLFNKKYTKSRTQFFEKIPFSSTAKEAFLDEKMAFYVGFASEKNEIQKKLSGYSEISAIKKDGKSVGRFSRMMSLNKDSTREEKQISELMLRYALSEEGQSILCVQNQGVMPLNKKAFATYIDINESMSFIEPEEIEIMK